MRDAITSEDIRNLDTPVKLSMRTDDFCAGAMDSWQIYRAKRLVAYTLAPRKWVDDNYLMAGADPRKKQVQDQVRPRVVFL